MPNSNIETLLMIFIVITAVAVLLQACVLLGMFLTMRKALETGKEGAEEFRAKIDPVLDSTKELMQSGKELVQSGKDLMTAARGLIADIEPHLESAATELDDMTRDFHHQANRLQAAVDEVALKARLQADRVDHMATSTLNGLERFGSFVNEVVNLPVRQLSGIVAAAKAVVGVMRAPSSVRSHRPLHPAPVADDKDLFV
jgi:methyl-accepting chemotaxis protein